MEAKIGQIVLTYLTYYKHERQARFELVTLSLGS